MKAAVKSLICIAYYSRWQEFTVTLHTQLYLVRYDQTDKCKLINVT